VLFAIVDQLDAVGIQDRELLFDALERVHDGGSLRLDSRPEPSVALTARGFIWFPRYRHILRAPGPAG
jgi:hypothetical protein